MKLLILICILAFPTYAYTAIDPKLDAACEAAREAKLAPERKSLIKLCISEGKSQAECNNFYKSHGDAGGSTNTGSYTKRKYNNLPECVAAREAREKYRAGSNRKNETRDSGKKRTNYR